LRLDEGRNHECTSADANAVGSDVSTPTTRAVGPSLSYGAPQVIILCYRQVAVCVFHKPAAAALAVSVRICHVSVPTSHFSICFSASLSSQPAIAGVRFDAELAMCGAEAGAPTPHSAAAIKISSSPAAPAGRASGLQAVVGKLESRFDLNRYVMSR